MVRLVIPLLPPSVNHYKVPNHFGRGFHVTPEGLAYKAAVAIFARGQSIAPATDAERKKVRYRLRVVVVLGVKRRGDGDNFWKCIADGLQEAGVIHSDARVRHWDMTVDDWTRPECSSTEIECEVM
jgi:Holliday junction resolvase RusA-like endonuclease